MLGHQGCGLAQNIVHHGLGLAYGEAADAIAGKVHLRQLLHTHFAQIGEHAPLHNAEEGLVLTGVGLLAALSPATGAQRGALGIFVIRRIGNAFVKGHGDICAQGLLHMGGDFGREELLAAINVGAEHYALLRDFAHGAQAEDLEAAAIGEHALFVVHEFVQTASLLHQLVAGAQEQMIGVGQDHLTAHVIQLFGREGFDGGLRAHGHEHRGFKGAVGRVQAAQTGAATAAFFN